MYQRQPTPGLGRRLSLVNGSHSAFTRYPPDHIDGNTELLGDISVKSVLDMYCVRNADNFLDRQVAVPSPAVLVAEATLRWLAPIQLYRKVSLPSALIGSRHCLYIGL